MIAVVSCVRGIEFLCENIFSASLVKLLVILMNVTSR
jgi:hypothetical protein